MSQIQKIVGANILILLLYNLLMGRGAYASVGLMFAIAAHMFLLFVIAMVLFGLKRNKEGRAFVLSMGLVLLVGFPICWIGAVV